MDGTMRAVVTTGATIMVVEDEATIADQIESTLTELGYVVSARASTADEAIRSAALRRPDLVLMDIRLRGLRDGIQTAEELRDRFRLPVVFLSAHADEATLKRAKRSSPYGYVVKPFKISDLLTSVEIALERHSLETRIRESERWFSTVLHSIVDAVLCTDLHGGISFMNPRAEALTGWSFAEAQERPVGEVVRIAAGEGPGSIETALGEAMADRLVKAMPDDSFLIDRSGERHAIDLNVAPICHDEKVLGAVLVFRDLTDRRALQRRLEFADRLAALGTMAAGVAHEVNNPLAVILANLNLLQDALGRDGSASGRPALDAQTLDDLLRDSSQAADRVRRIVADLRSFTQPADQVSGPADLGRALRWALQATAHEFRHRARVVADIGPLPHVDGPEARLGQLFVNLLVNAAQAILPGRVNDNEVRVAAYTGARGQAVIEVRDSGAGIPGGIVSRIFDPFFTTKPPGVGSGLGLSVCHGIVQSLGGDISVQSQLHTGSTFKVVLPPAPARPAAEAQAASAGEEAAEAGRARVLVIDDEPLVRRAIVRSLDREHDVVSVETAAEALIRLEGGESFDLILCDLMMPEMTGMEMSARLQRSLPAAAARMVFLSGGAFTPEAAEFLRSIGTRFVEKPFLPDELSRRVTELLQSVRSNGSA
jgi:PAS domain S-box-containing protein